MTTKPAPCCAICLESRSEADGWFLLTENRWTDRLKILGWSDALVAQPGVLAACGAAHVQQLVVHWMATGSLEYPFARSRPGAHPQQKRASNVEPPHRDLDTGNARVIGELAVHRDSLNRVLRENPESLASILTALISALNESRAATGLQEEAEQVEEYALTEV